MPKREPKKKLWKERVRSFFFSQGEFGGIRGKQAGRRMYNRTERMLTRTRGSEKKDLRRRKTSEGVKEKKEGSGGPRLREKRVASSSNRGPRKAETETQPLKSMNI